MTLGPFESAVHDLSRSLVADEIARVRRERWSGVLALRQGQVSKGLYCVDGEVAFAASTVEEDRLGAMLFRAGKISESQFREAMRASERGRPLGQAFVDAGILTAADLQAAVLAQIERIVLSVLRWTSGELRRETMDRPIPVELAVVLDTPRLLLLGMRLFPDAARLEREIGPPGRMLRRAGRAAFDYDGVSPAPAERAVLALCLRPTAVEDLFGLPHPRGDVARAAAALLAGGLLEEAPLATPSPGASLAPDILARRLLEKGDRARALEVLRAAIERDPQARGSRRLLAMVLARDGGFDVAVERHFTTALEAEPGDLELRYALASYYRRAGLGGRALLQLRLVLAGDPSHAAAWRDLGELEAANARRGR
jgi:tetratricopeptide (TPR) repeat protein